MLAPFKLLLAILCLLSTIGLYVRNLSSSPALDVAFPQSNAPESTTPSSYENDAAIPNPSSTMARNRVSKILQATMMFGHNYKGLNERTLQSHSQHAELWGYGDRVLTREIVGAGEVEGEGLWNKYIFSKILYVLKIMIIELEKPREERAEWIVWYDADTLILNPNIPWEVFLPPRDNDSFTDIKILATKDISGFNAGLFFCRVDEWVVDALTDAYALPRLHPEVDILGNIEQNAMKWIFSKDENRKHVVYQPSLWYNWFSTVERPDGDVKGDMVIHFSGINHDNEGQLKKTIMETWFRKMQSDPDAWSVPLEKTKYPKEVPAFWRLLRVAREILSLVKDRGDTSTIDTEHTIQVARNELKWAVEEEAYDFGEMNKTIVDMLEALRVSERPEEQALLKAYAKEEATETLAQGRLGAGPQAAAQEAISAPDLATGDSQNSEENARQRFSRISPGSEHGSVVYG